jgi:hypothetical protein
VLRDAWVSMHRTAGLGMTPDNLGRDVAVSSAADIEAMLGRAGFSESTVFFQALLISAWRSRAWRGRATVQYERSGPVATTDGLGSHWFYHGTRADLKPGDLIEAGHPPNFGKRDRTTTYVCLTGTLDAATWGAELALGEGPGRIYLVEPTGPIMGDPNLTNTRYPGNPTKSYRSRELLRVMGEVTDWQRHSPETIQAMKDRIEGLGPIDD